MSFREAKKQHSSDSFGKAWGFLKRRTQSLSAGLELSCCSVLERKIFFSIVAKRPADFFLNNGNIDILVKKGYIPGAPD